MVNSWNRKWILLTREKESEFAKPKLNSKWLREIDNGFSVNSRNWWWIPEIESEFIDKSRHSKWIHSDYIVISRKKKVNS